MSLRTIAALAALAVLSSAWAQSFPSKPVRVIVTFPPGGTPDIYGRVMSVELAKLWNQSVVVENRTGAGGRICWETAAKSAPDGTTAALIDATYTMLPGLFEKLPWDVASDLVPAA
ncbi:MAG TPA: tripartite tricarboxylate transporter substrate-binding protein, partial [Burkholderiales bacterium]|nr:tripartite tricarboxylate transporter substrate-binding protein [Burkholderiales bacterium]